MILNARGRGLLERVLMTDAKVVRARVLIAVAGTTAIVVPGLLAYDQLDVVPWIAAPLLLAAIIAPDSSAPLGFVLMVAGGWILRARGHHLSEQDPAIVDRAMIVVAVALLTVHLASAYAAQVPPTAALGPGLLRSWLLPAGGAALVVPLAVVMTDQVQSRAIRPSLIVTMAGLLAVVACAGYAAGLARRRRRNQTTVMDRHS